MDGLDRNACHALVVTLCEFPPANKGSSEPRLGPPPALFCRSQRAGGCFKGSMSRIPGGKSTKPIAVCSTSPADRTRQGPWRVEKPTDTWPIQFSHVYSRIDCHQTRRLTEPREGIHSSPGLVGLAPHPTGAAQGNLSCSRSIWSHVGTRAGAPNGRTFSAHSVQRH